MLFHFLSNLSVTRNYFGFSASVLLHWAAGHEHVTLLVQRKLHDYATTLGTNRICINGVQFSIILLSLGFNFLTPGC